MIRVVFFAQVRERLDCAALEVSLPAQGLDLDGLQAQLCADHPPVWREVLSQTNIIRAVNHAVVSDNCPLQSGDEVAFYPPVTGG